MKLKRKLRDVFSRQNDDQSNATVTRRINFYLRPSLPLRSQEACIIFNGKLLHQISDLVVYAQCSCHVTASM